MRQAGRYLPEYRRLREKVDFLTLTKTPDLAAEVTLQPIRRFSMDAAILFADIMTPLEGMGVELEFAPGPVIAEPVRSRRQVEALRSLDAEEAVPFVLETIRILRRELAADTPLIGFAGAPFTLFCYLVEGGGSKTFPAAKTFLLSQPETARRLLHKLGETTAAYLTAQAQAGAQALMLFDSWAGLLGPDDYAETARPVVADVLERLAPLGVPLIYFPNQGATLIDQVADLPVDVVGIDWRLPLDRARAALGPDKAVQGNLDPAALFAPPAELERRIRRVLDQASPTQVAPAQVGPAQVGPARGHIFNLGHGIERTTDPDQVARLVDCVHELTATTGAL